MITKTKKRVAKTQPKLTTYQRLMAEAKVEYEAAMLDRKRMRLKKILDHALPRRPRAAE